MSIRFTKYININSAVGGASQVPLRLWVARVFTTNPRVGPNAVLQFDVTGGTDDIGDFFGSTSEEFNRTAAYASYESPLGTAPQAIQFARYVADDQPATIFGEAQVANLAALKLITAGKLSFMFGQTPVNITGISFASATSFADVATALQTAIRAATGAPNGELSAATVTFDATAQAFDFSASPTVTATETFRVVTPASITTQTDVAAALGWYASQGALVNDAALAEAAVDSFNRVQSANNNFGSFVYTDAADLQLSDVTAIALANAALNVMFIFRVPVTPTNWATYQAALIGIAGVGLEYEDVVAAGGRQYLEMLPMSIQAAINFNATNGAVGFMYKQNALFNPSINDNPGTVQSDTLDAARVNYYGVTQTGGQQIAFYQTGVLCGGATAPVDSTVFANEQWFKDMCGANLMNLQLSSGQIPANARGVNMCDAALQGNQATALAPATGIELAVQNGVISTNSTLTTTQQIFITQQSGSATAWQQVQTIGYWKKLVIVPQTNNGVTTYTLQYTIIYRKDDVIKKINGSHQLI
jgi:hypothetical protein